MIDFLLSPFRFAGWMLRSLWTVGVGLFVLAVVLVTLASLVGVAFSVPA